MLPGPLPVFRPSRRRWATALGSALLLAGAFLARRLSSPPLPSSQAMLPDLSLARAAGGASLSDPSRLARARVLSAVDGDTLRVLWDGAEVKLRYYGVDTPERGEPCHDEAAARNAALAGAEVLLAFDERSRDKYGRLLAYAFTPEGRSLDAALIAEGLGRAWTRDGRWRDALDELEREARRDKRGCLWSRPGEPVRSRRAPRRGGPRAR